MNTTILSRQVLVLITVIASVCLGGCGTTPPAGQSNITAAQLSGDCDLRVYCLRGLWDTFSTGLDDLTHEFLSIGVNARSVSGVEWPTFAQEIAADFAARPNHGPLVLIGHSFGVDDAVSLAIELRDHGVTVNLLISLDGTFPAPVPDNVDHVIHLYQPSLSSEVFPNTFAGNPMTAEAGNTHTQIDNIIANRENLGDDLIPFNHYNIDQSEQVHEYTINEALKLCGPMSPDGK